jgi:Cu-Zn family superoxide dismutase
MKRLFQIATLGAAALGLNMAQAQAPSAQTQGAPTTTTQNAVTPGHDHVADQASGGMNKDDATHAAAIMQPRNNSKAKGEVKFDETPEGLKVTYKLQGLKPNANLGFHIHDFGDCSSKDAKSAGSHYAEIAPTGGTAADSPAKHAGDLPQVKTDAKGMAEGSFVAQRLSIDNEFPIAGRAIIVHGGPDDPSKKASARKACGEIKIKAPAASASM